MEKKKDKIRIRRYSCNYCNCTGYFNRKQLILQNSNWGYQFINKDICNYCEGRGYIVFKRKYEDINNYQSFLISFVSIIIFIILIINIHKKKNVNIYLLKKT